MKITLTDAAMLPRFEKKFNVKNQNKDDTPYFDYSEEICGKIFGEISPKHLEKLGIDRFETLFIGSGVFSSFRAFSLYNKKLLAKISNSDYKRQLREVFLLREAIKGKHIYISTLSNEKGYYEFTLPEPLYFEVGETNSDDKRVKKIAKRLKKINSCRIEKEKKKPNKINTKKIRSYLTSVNLKSLKSLISLAIRDLDFITRFNNEMFYQNISYNGRIYKREEIINIYEAERYSKIIDLSDTRERTAFISLYGIAAKGLELKDFYSVDGIFTLQENRERDRLKQLAGQEIFGYILSGDKASLTEAMRLMGETLLKINIPFININDYQMLRQNYTMYIGISDIGRIYSRVFFPDNDNGENKLEKYHRAAARVIDYSLAEKYCNLILKGESETDFCNAPIYDALTRFEDAVKDKITVAELNHGSKEFKI